MSSGLSHSVSSILCYTDFSVTMGTLLEDSLGWGTEVRLEPGLESPPLSPLESSYYPVISLSLFLVFLGGLQCWTSLPLHIPLSHGRQCLFLPLFLPGTPECGHYWHVTTSEILNSSILWPQSNFYFIYFGTLKRPLILSYLHFFYTMSITPSMSYLDPIVQDFNHSLAHARN